jgi:SAM-dependent methyltransferase
MSSTRNRFGYEWSRYNALHPLYEVQFQAWTTPLKVADWQGLRVLDAGCGTGRNSYWPLRYGAKQVVSFDVDDRSVAVATKNLQAFPNSTVKQGSIYDPQVPEFDLAFSIGVVHHLADPRLAVRRLVEAVRPGGRVLIWVYGREGHTGLKVVVNAVRKVTCRIPLPLLRVMVYPVSLIWWLYMRLARSQHAYVQQFKHATLWHVHSILFDQLLPEIANYWTKAEAMALFEGLPVKDVHAHFINEGSWSVWATKI